MKLSEVINDFPPTNRKKKRRFFVENAKHRIENFLSIKRFHYHLRDIEQIRAFKTCSGKNTAGRPNRKENE